MMALSCFEKKSSDFNSTFFEGAFGKETVSTLHKIPVQSQ